MNTLVDVVTFDNFDIISTALPEPVAEYAADVVDALHAVEIGDYMATA